MPSPADFSTLKVRIAHVLGIDVVGYSLLLITDQTRVMNELTAIAKNTEAFRRADSAGALIRIPTGDGMWLVFLDDPQAPLECALEIATALRNNPGIPLRMGIHSGPVNEIVDVNDRSNLTGAGMDTTQRVLNCGDTGHILLSRRVADDLAPYPRWNAHLHDLGDWEVKHGRRLGLVNFYNGEVGNPAPPRDLTSAAGATPTPPPATRPRGWLAAAAFLAVAALAGALFLARSRVLPSRGEAPDPRQAIAVLPFENASGDPNAEYLAEGISEALINSLAELPQLRVTARSTAFHYKGDAIDPPKIGRELGVTSVLTGKVRQVQDALSVQVDLIDTASGAQLWGAAYERKIADAIAIKQAIARSVTEKLKLRLTGDQERRLVQRDPTNPEAYQLYLKGRYFWNKRTEEGLERGIRYFQEAIEADANYALAHVGLADSYNFLGAFGIALRPPGEVMPKARAAAQQALAIDESLAEAHASLAFVQLYYEWDRAAAENAFQRAIALNPNYAAAHQWYSHLLMSAGRTSEAIASATRAAEIDPLSLPAGMNLGWQYYWSRQYEAAVERLGKVLEIDPNFEQAHWGLGLAYEGRHLPDQAAAEFQKAAELSGKNPVYVAALGRAYALGGNKEAALEVRARLEDQAKTQYVSPYWMATLNAGLGDVDQALLCLEKAYQERSGGLIWLDIDPGLDSLRADARFTALVRRAHSSR